MASSSNSRKRNLTGKLLEQSLEQWLEEDNEHEFSDVDDEVFGQNFTIEEEELVESEISEVEEIEIETSSEGTNRSTNTPDSNRNCYRDVTRLLKDIVLLQQEVKIIKDNYVTKTHLEELKKDKSFLKTSTSPAHHHKVGRRCSAFLLDVGTTFGDSGPMGLSHELSTADVPLQTTDVQTETEKIAIAQVASRARDSVDALAPVSDMHKADLFTSGGVTAYNGADGRQSFSAGGAKTTQFQCRTHRVKAG
ncbi:unnamed protein product [Parnassius apollo]|uniref:(apollo) hypothetical protein n=1 Tax=Parnassius apollo TaxID=110799 RepID=A0A8S3Y3N0_PARAO|nr:unnamed protein product [Parnassius apollo]